MSNSIPQNRNYNNLSGWLQPKSSFIFDTERSAAVKQTSSINKADLFKVRCKWGCHCFTDVSVIITTTLTPNTSIHTISHSTTVYMWKMPKYRNFEHNTHCDRNKLYIHVAKKQIPQLGFNDFQLFMFIHVKAEIFLTKQVSKPFKCKHTCIHNSNNDQ